MLPEKEYSIQGQLTNRKQLLSTWSSNNEARTKYKIGREELWRRLRPPKTITISSCVCRGGTASEHWDRNDPWYSTPPCNKMSQIRCNCSQERKTLVCPTAFRLCHLPLWETYFHFLKAALANLTDIPIASSCAGIGEIKACFANSSRISFPSTKQW